MIYLKYALLLIPYSLLMLYLLYLSMLVEIHNGTKYPAVKIFLLWLMGGVVYIVMEICFRGYSHWTMFILGGICFIEIGLENEFLKWDTPIELQALIGAILVTANEFIFGLIVNKGFGLHVWDYTGQPFNILGQICLPFTILWFFVSILAIVVDDILRYYLWGEETPRYYSVIFNLKFTLMLE